MAGIALAPDQARMNHYCTYFDRGFAAQGLALWRSLAARDREAVLWVLALDEFTDALLRELAEPNLRVVGLPELERADPELAEVKAGRSRVEYYFTLSPCWPHWLLATRPDMSRLTYLDADLYFFGSPAPIFQAMDDAAASVLITAHRFPSWLRGYERHGRFNVGILSFRNDVPGRGCLAEWRANCLEWCADRVEGGRYADQKYLDHWPARWGRAVLVLEDARVNVAPWNWIRHRLSVDRVGTVHTESGELILFHFARFRLLRGTRWWQSGHLDYGVMPRRLRHAIYGPYWRALMAARDEIRARRPEFDFPLRPLRLGRDYWRALPLRIVFGGDWLRIGARFYNLRFGLGRWSGHLLALLRTIFFRRNRTTESTSQPQQRHGAK